MLRDLLSNSRAIQAVLAFFVLVVGGSLLYNWHVQYTTESDLERHDRFLQGLEKHDETRPVEAVSVPTEIETPGFVRTPEEIDEPQMSEDMDVLPIDEASEFADIVDAFLPDDFVSDEPAAENVPVLPYGFGPYPEVPNDYFRTPVWAYPDSEFTPGHELIDRVLIKLWKQGIYSNGGGMENGRVYPIIRGTVYVKWKGDSISEYIGHPDDDDGQIISILEDKGTPTGITVLDYDAAGIDPYQFLNL